MMIESIKKNKWEDPHYGLVACMAFICLIAIMPATQLWDWDESFYGRTAIEMLRSGNYLVPAFNGEIFPHKTPLIYWLMALSVSVFGETEFAVRFVSAPAIAGTMVLIYLIGKRIANHNTGIASMAVFGSSLLTIALGTAALLDAVLVLSICISFYAYIRILWPQEHESNKTSVLMFGIGMLLSLYAKGPVGPVVIVSGVIASWILLAKQQLPSIKIFYALAISGVVAGLGFLAWLIPAILNGGKELITEGIGLHIVGRALSPMEGHGGSGLIGYLTTLPIYLPVVVIGMMPWAILLPSAFVNFFRKNVVDRKVKVVLLSWCVPIFAVFSFSATKLPHYIFPVFPVVSLIVGLYISSLMNEKLKLSRIAGYFLFFAFYTAASIAFFYLYVGQVMYEWGLSLILISILIFVFSWFVFYLLQKNKKNVLVVMFLGSYLSVASVYWLVLPKFESVIKISKEMGELINKEAIDDSEIYMAGYTEPSLVFYSHLNVNKTFNFLNTSGHQLAQIVSSPKKLIFIVTEAEYQMVVDALKGRSFAIVKQMNVINTNNDKRVREVSLIVSNSI